MNYLLVNDETESAFGLIMDDTEVYSFLGLVFIDVFGRNDIVIHPKLSSHDVFGWDSFKQVEIVLALEEKFGIRILTRELNNISNVGELVELVVSKSEASR